MWCKQEGSRQILDWKGEIRPADDHVSPNTDFLVNMAASADVLAQAKVEIDLNAIPEGKNVRFALSPPPPMLHFPPTTLVQLLNIICNPLGNHQMARQARLHSPPHRRRDQRSRRHEMGIAARSAARLRSRPETRVADYAWYDISYPVTLFCLLP